MNPLLPVLAPSGRSARGSHQLSAADVCETLWDLKYNHGYSQKEDKKYRLGGTLIHLALAYYYAAKMPDPPPWFRAEDLNAALERRGRGFPDLIQKAKEVMVAYGEWYTRVEPDPWIPRFIEQEFSARVGDLDPPPYAPGRGPVDRSLDSEVVTCAPDLIVELPDPAVPGPSNFIVDFKSWKPNWKGGRLEDWDDNGRFVLDWQVLVNLQIVRQHMPIRGFIIQRMLRQPVRGQYDFDRHVLSIPTCAYAEDAPRELRRCVQLERDIRQRIAAGVRPNRSLWACWNGWGACDFRAVCSAKSPEQKLEVLQKDYVREAK